jgi:hypothetical protein
VVLAAFFLTIELDSVTMAVVFEVGFVVVLVVLMDVFEVVLVGFAVASEEALVLAGESACLQLERQPVPQNSIVVPHLPSLEHLCYG